MRKSIPPKKTKTFSSYTNEAKPIDYFQLLKPRVMFLVIFTALISIIIAPGNLHPYLKLLSLLAIAIGSGAAGCLNMWYERFTDMLMVRTATRPLPKKLIQAENALAFGSILSVASIILLGMASNIWSALWLTFTIFFYVIIYTIILKPRTSYNIIIGGAAGALPPVIAWQAVAPGWYLMPWLMFAIIFFWTPPHFWSLSLLKAKEYEKANIPVLPNTHGEASTRKYILLYTLLTVLTSLSPVYFGLLGNFYIITASIAGAVLFYYACRLYMNKFGPMNFFYLTIFYLFWIFLSIAIDNFI